MRAYTTMIDVVTTAPSVVAGIAWRIAAIHFWLRAYRLER
jgi:hypothetical protein